MFELAFEVFSNALARKYGWKKWAVAVLSIVVVPAVVLLLVRAQA